MRATQKLTLKPGQSPHDLLKEVMKGTRSGKSKYNAQKTEGYDSKKEWQYAQRLQTLKRAGAILGWLEQVPIELSAEIVYRVDFLVFDLNGAARFVEVKGYETKEWILKKKLLRELHPWIFERLEVV